MASKAKQGKGRGSYKREATKRANGYYTRQRARTDKNIRQRLDTHISAHPDDKVAKVALKKRG